MLDFLCSTARLFENLGLELSLSLHCALRFIDPLTCQLNRPTEKKKENKQRARQEVLRHRKSTLKSEFV